MVPGAEIGGEQVVSVRHIQRGKEDRLTTKFEGNGRSGDGGGVGAKTWGGDQKGGFFVCRYSSINRRLLTDRHHVTLLHWLGRSMAKSGAELSRISVEDPLKQKKKTEGVIRNFGCGVSTEGY